MNGPMIMKRSFVVAGLATLAALLFVAGLLMLPPVAATGTKSGVIGGPFRLVDGDGRTVTDQSFRGRWMLVYFGYTRCPDACPTALQDMASAMDLLGPASARKIAAVFITVDPDRDTPAALKDYVSSFGPAFTGLSGDPAGIKQAEQNYRVFAAKHPTGDGDYAMDHSSIIYVMDPEGRFVTNFTHETSPEQMAERLKKLGA